MKRTIFASIALAAALILFAPRPAHAAGDSVRIFANLHVPADEKVEDAVCIFCNARIEGRVTGDLVVIFGSVQLAGDAQHDLVNIFGSVTAAHDASIEGNLVGVFSVTRLGENVTIGQDVVNIFGTLHAAPSAIIRGDRTFIPGYAFFLPLLVLIAIVLVIVREFRTQRRAQRLRGVPGA